MSDVTITGIELMANKFFVIVTAMRKKPYDFLDQRKTEFDMDFDDFKRQVAELHVSLISTRIIKFLKEVGSWGFITKLVNFLIFLCLFSF